MYSVLYCPWFQASPGGFGMYHLQIRETVICISRKSVKNSKGLVNPQSKLNVYFKVGRRGRG